MKNLPKIAKSHIAGISFAVAMAAAPSMLQAQATGENLIKNGDAEIGDFSGWWGFQSMSDKAQDGANAFVLGPNKEALSLGIIEVNPDAIYELTGSAMAVEGTSKVHFGLRCLDADKKMIRCEWVSPIEGTETKLLEAATKGATVLKIENGQAWKIGGNTPLFGCVAFNVDDSGAFADLPNREVSDLVIKAIRQVGGHWEVELAKPLTADFSAGTKVRQHENKMGCFWVKIKDVEQSWGEVKGSASGVSSTGIEPGKFWPGTKFIQVQIFNMNAASNVLLDNLVLRFE